MLLICGALISFILGEILSIHGNGLTDIHIEEYLLEILITPIILHASYSLYHPHFFGQIGTILIMAFLATTLNVLLITPIMTGLYQYGFRPLSQKPAKPEFNLFDSVTYASLISAVVSITIYCISRIIVKS